MSAPVFPDSERTKGFVVMWTMKAEILVRNEQFTDAQQPREPELLDEDTLLEMAKIQIENNLPDGPLLREDPEMDPLQDTDYELINCTIHGDTAPCY